MKILRLVIWILCCTPGLVLAEVEFRFITDDTGSAKEYLHDRIDESYFLEDPAVITLDDLKTVNSGFSDSGSPAISIEFLESGQQRFAQATAQAADKTLAMLIDGRVIADATIRGEINATSVQLPLDASVREVAGYVVTINNELAQRDQQKVVQQQEQARKNLLAERLNQQSRESSNSGVGLVSKVEELAKGVFGKKLLDVLFNNIFYIFIGLFFFFPLVKKLLPTLFSTLSNSATKGRTGASKKLLRKLPIDFSFNRFEESAADKGQRLLGEGRFVEALRYLRPYVLQHPKDEQAQALLANAMQWSGLNERVSKKQRKNKAHDARREVQSQKLRARSSSSNNRKQAQSTVKMTREHALRIARARKKSS